MPICPTCQERYDDADYPVCSACGSVDYEETGYYPVDLYLRRSITPKRRKRKPTTDRFES